MPLGLGFELRVPAVNDEGTAVKKELTTNTKNENTKMNSNGIKPQKSRFCCRFAVSTLEGLEDRVVVGNAEGVLEVMDDFVALGFEFGIPLGIDEGTAVG